MFYLAFWRQRSTATVVEARNRQQARARARQKQGYGELVSLQQARPEDAALIRRGVWVRRRRDGSSPQFGSAAERQRARRQRSQYRSWL
jgi:hypothetical protein